MSVGTFCQICANCGPLRNNLRGMLHYTGGICYTQSPHGPLHPSGYRPQKQTPAATRARGFFAGLHEYTDLLSEGALATSTALGKLAMLFVAACARQTGAKGLFDPQNFRTAEGARTMVGGVEQGQKLYTRIRPMAVIWVVNMPAG